MAMQDLSNQSPEEIQDKIEVIAILLKVDPSEGYWDAESKLIRFKSGGFPDWSSSHMREYGWSQELEFLAKYRLLKNHVAFADGPIGRFKTGRGNILDFRIFGAYIQARVTKKMQKDDPWAEEYWEDCERITQLSEFLKTGYSIKTPHDEPAKFWAKMAMGISDEASLNSAPGNDLMISALEKEIASEEDNIKRSQEKIAAAQKKIKSLRKSLKTA